MRLLGRTIWSFGPSKSPNTLNGKAALCADFQESAKAQLRTSGEIAVAWLIHLIIKAFSMLKALPIFLAFSCVLFTLSKRLPSPNIRTRKHLWIKAAYRDTVLLKFMFSGRTEIDTKRLVAAQDPWAELYF